MDQILSICSFDTLQVEFIIIENLTHRYKTLYKYYMVWGEVGQTIFLEVLTMWLLSRGYRPSDNSFIASTEG